MRVNRCSVVIVSVAATLAACATTGGTRSDAGTLALGKSVFDGTCAACHSIQPPARLAPPMTHVATHYLEQTPDTAAAVQRIELWLSAPAKERSALPAHAIEQWGVMPPLQLDRAQRHAVARYVVTLTRETAGGAQMEQHRGGMQRMGGMHPGMRMRPGMGAIPRAREQTPAMTPETQAAVTRIAEPAATALRTTLVRRLSAALQSGPPEQAIDVCATEALSLTDSVARAAGGGVTLKRAALRVRNPRNQPDSLETTALHWFEEQSRQGAQPAAYVQAAGAEGYRYYVPLRVAELCLNCHGPVEQLTPAVRRVLQQRYPGDRATGYSIGDLRGVLRVGVPAAALHAGH